MATNSATHAMASTYAVTMRGPKPSWSFQCFFSLSIVQKQSADMLPRRFWKCSFKSLQMLVANTERKLQILKDMRFVRPYPFYVDASAKLRKTIISLVMSVCLSVRPSVCTHGTNRLPQERFSLNFTFEYFSKNLSIKLNLY